jgi:hypothetical protein
MSIVRSTSKRLPFSAAFVFLAAAAAGIAAAVGCSDSTSSSTTTPDAGRADVGTGDSAATGGTMQIVITYTGTQKGPAICTAWPKGDFPADTDFPIGTGSNEKPTWPGTNSVTISDLKPGKAWGLCYIMVGLDHRMGPAGTDPVQDMLIPAIPDIAAGQTSTVTVTLNDPPPADMDAGSEAGDASSDAPDGG